MLRRGNDTLADPGRKDVRVALLTFGKALNDRVLSPDATNGTAHVLMREYASGLTELTDRVEGCGGIEGSWREW